MPGLKYLSFAVVTALAMPALADPPAVSPLPMPRPADGAVTVLDVSAPSRRNVLIEVIAEEAIEVASADLGLSLTEDEVLADEATAEGGTAAEVEISALASETSPRPVPRADVPADFAERAALLRAEAEADEAARRPPRTSDPEFRAWIAEFEARALAAGISAETFARAFDGLQLNTRVLERDRNQAEFSRALWDYLDTAVSATRIRNGREALSEWRTTLGRIEAQYQVEAEVVVAVWGLESAYGAMRGSEGIVEAMASLAFDGRRQDFFEEQLIAALQILEAGDTRARNMTGSWAGAMGHTQFMPTSYLEFAQDFDDDGRRNIWSDNPVDALASTAHYLVEHGWVYGQPWGMEVRLPEGFDYRLAGEQERIGAAFWNAMGVRLVNGDPLPDHGPASILLPAGAEGVALVVHSNFRVIERYNPADAYVIAIGHLSDRINGGPGFEAGWPRGDRALTFAEREELQRLLRAVGHYDERIDGIVGPITIASVRSYQEAIGVTPDGYASVSILQRLRDG
ncbi:lytic murein transglycosylase [Jannaschia sp. CCS1]|uniref:lytic murein transglycosylase n=1 Tax=Jannaschia sp. (strain CCS1) TaxID=290400 RepID=UPI00006BFF76|nr:lytic murein transglycosylase [Jannaschia sp. CCS1]ABD53274.1 Lytic murein transglycosylase [Jannaschia sp. CCS1]